MWSPGFLRRLRSNRAPAVAAIVMAAMAAAFASPRTAIPLSAAVRGQLIAVLAEAGDPVAPDADDAQLSAAIVDYARTEAGLRLRPAGVDRMWAIQPATRNLETELANAGAEGRLAAWVSDLPPPYAQYRALRSAEARYAKIVAAGGWPMIAKGPSLREGQQGPQVAVLRTRLASEGYGQSGASAPERFDPALREALADFQRHHNLPDDGSLGADTRAALNVSAQDRLMQITANLERWRWMPRRLPGERIEVDIGGAQATLFRGGTSPLSMKAVVGDPRHHTPMFASRVEMVVFNPPWKVPDSIAAKEIFPKARRDPGYLARGHFVILNGRLTQMPGPKNSLGQVKFDLPSPFGVYLHDTPVKSAFQRRVRTLSHGCMRLEKPRELALALLARQGWTEEMIEQAIAAGPTQTVRLKQSVPLYVVYWTAVVGDDGQVDFRPDAYGWDRKLVSALAAKT